VITSQKMRSHMARYARCGCGASRCQDAVRGPRLLQPTVRWILPLLLLVLGLSVPLAAQDDNVHITPRPTPAPEPVKPPEDPKIPGVVSDPGLKVNHGKPLRSEVDLVLVHVTVTDDWNRIVTGLDKENFAIMEGNEVQQVKHFSSEDAPLSLGV